MLTKFEETKIRFLSTINQMLKNQKEDREIRKSIEDIMLLFIKMY